MTDGLQAAAVRLPGGVHGRVVLPALLPRLRMPALRGGLLLLP